MGVVRRKQNHVKVMEEYPQRSMHTLGEKKKQNPNREDSELPTVDFKAVDLDKKVECDHRKLTDRKVENIWIVAVYYIWG